MSEHYTAADYEKALVSITAAFKITTKAMEKLSKAAKIASRDITRAMRRKPLIHNGRKP